MSVNIKDFQMVFQSYMSIKNHEILLQDIPKKSLIIGTEEPTILSVKSDELRGGQVLALSIECTLPQGGYLLEEYGSTVNVSYNLFGEIHKDSINVNPENMSFQMPPKEEIVFDLIKVLDHRVLPEHFINYHYTKIMNKSGDRTLDIYCSDGKSRLLKVLYKSPNRSVVFESEIPIHREFDPIRVFVLANDSIQIQSKLGYFRREDIAEQYRLGTELSNKGNFIDGSKAFKKVIEQDSNDFKAWFNYGLALEHLGDYKSSIDAFQNAIKVKGDYFKAHGELANVLIRIGDNLGAANHLSIAIKINPQYAHAYYTLACLQKSQSKNDEAVRNLNNAIKYENDNKMRDKYKRLLLDLY